MTVDSLPERILPRAGYSNSISSGNYRKSPWYPIPKRESYKHEDSDEYSLPDFTEPPITHNNTKIKVDPNWTDSDQDIGVIMKLTYVPPQVSHEKRRIRYSIHRNR